MLGRVTAGRRNSTKRPQTRSPGVAEALGHSPKCCDQWPTTEYYELGLWGWTDLESWFASSLPMAGVSV